MLDEEKLKKMKKRAAKPQWTHVKVLAEDMLVKAVAAENERRESVLSGERQLLRDKVIAGSKLGKLFAGFKGVTLSADFDSRDDDVDVTATFAGVEGDLTEAVPLPTDVKRRFAKLEHIPCPEHERKEAAATVAAYVVVDAEANPEAALLDLISLRVTDWVKAH